MIEQDVDMDLFGPAWDRLNERVTEACRKAGHKKVAVLYSNYESEGSAPIDNLDDVAFHGQLILVAKANSFWDGAGTSRRESDKGRSYVSEILMNPTWLEVAVRANEAIIRTNDYHHIYFEGICPVSPMAVPTWDDEVLTYQFQMGS